MRVPSLTQRTLKTLIQRAFRHPARALLTALGVAVATAVVSVTFGLYLSGQIALGALSSQLAGVRTLELREEILLGDSRAWRTVSALSLKELEWIQQQSPAVQAIWPDVEPASGVIEVEGDRYRLSGIRAHIPELLEIAGLELKAGRWITPEEREGRRPVMVLSERAARALFGDQDPVGRTLRWNPSASAGAPGGSSGGSSGGSAQSFTVVGVYQDAGPAVASTLGEMNALVPLGWRWDRFASAMFAAVPGREAQAAAEVEAAFRERFGAEMPLTIARAVQGGGMGEDWLQGLLVFSGFGFLAALAGAVGVMSMSLVNVVERTREIGIRRALGASMGQVQALFFGEALTVVLPGAAAGAGAAWAAAGPFARTLGELGRPIPATFHPAALAAAVATAVAITVALSWVPVRAVCRIPPSETIR